MYERVLKKEKRSGLALGMALLSTREFLLGSAVKPLLPTSYKILSAV